MTDINNRLNELGIKLPKPGLPVANYVPYVITNSMFFISGQIPLGESGPEYIGKVGKDINVDTAINAARLCGINILAQLSAALDGDLNKVEKCVKLGGFVNAIDSFTDHPVVINGASDLMVEVFGDSGKHSRFAMGASGLPLGVAVEVDAIFSIS